MRPQTYVGVVLGLYEGKIGIMENKKEATLMGYIGFRVLSFRVLALGFYRLGLGFRVEGGVWIAVRTQTSV